MYDVIIIGAGPAGLTSLLYVTHYGLNALCIGDTIGGKLVNAPGIIDYPGIETMHGTDFISHLTTQITKVKGKVEQRIAIKISKDKETGEFSTTTTDGTQYTSRAVIIAGGNGNKQRENRSLQLVGDLGVLSENGLIRVDTFGKTNIDGMFACGDCISYPQSLEQLTTSVSTGITAAAGAFYFIKSEKPPILWGTAKIPRK